MVQCGYVTQSGYCGKVNAGWMLFSTETEYIEYISEQSTIEGSETDSDEPCRA